jgi:hypothetical protein
MRLTVIIVLVVIGVMLGDAARVSRGQSPSGSAKEPVSSQEKQQTIVGVDLGDVLKNRVVPPDDYTNRAVTDDHGLCAVHHHELTRTIVPINYGLIPGVAMDNFREVERTHFPNSITQIEGGCLVMDVKQAIVLQCDACLKARAKYFKHQ